MKQQPGPWAGKLESSIWLGVIPNPRSQIYIWLQMEQFVKLVQTKLLSPRDIGLRVKALQTYCAAVLPCSRSRSRLSCINSYLGTQCHQSANLAEMFLRANSPIFQMWTEAKDWGEAKRRNRKERVDRGLESTVVSWQILRLNKQEYTSILHYDVGFLTLTVLDEWH